MRHGNQSKKLNRTSSHRSSLLSNMLKSLIYHGRIETTVAKAKALKPCADRMVTLAKRNTLASKRKAIAELRICYNPLTAKEARSAKNQDKSGYNVDRQVMEKLTELSTRFSTRAGGYTRIIKIAKRRVGDDAETCIIEYLEA